MSDRPLFSPGTLQTIKGLRIFIIPAMLSVSLLGGLAIFAGCGPGRGNASAHAAPPLIVGSNGLDINGKQPLTLAASTDSAPSDVSPLKSTSPSAVSASKSPDTGSGQTRKTAAGAVPTANTAVARVQPGMIKVKAPRPQAASSPAWMCGEHPFVVRSDLAQQKLVNPHTLSPDTLDVQGIMNGSKNKAALVEGRLYRVGDRMGAQDREWTVASINESSVTMQREHNNRVFAVTVFAHSTGTVESSDRRGQGQGSGIR